MRSTLGEPVKQLIGRMRRLTSLNALSIPSVVRTFFLWAGGASKKLVFDEKRYWEEVADGSLHDVSFSIQGAMEEQGGKGALE